MSRSCWLWLVVCANPSNCWTWQLKRCLWHSEMTITVLGKCVLGTRQKCLFQTQRAYFTWTALQKSSRSSRSFLQRHNASLTFLNRNFLLFCMVPSPREWQLSQLRHQKQHGWPLFVVGQWVLLISKVSMCCLPPHKMDLWHSMEKMVLGNHLVVWRRK